MYPILFSVIFLKCDVLPNVLISKELYKSVAMTRKHLVLTIGPPKKNLYRCKLTEEKSVNYLKPKCKPSLWDLLLVFDGHTKSVYLCWSHSPMEGN